jgi:hypothetical protein
MARMARRTEANECRRCSTFCDRVIKPATCVAAGCPSLYHYDDPLTGRRYMGCLHKVFATEIDVELFAEAEKTRGGFGVVKLAGDPHPCCAFSVERAFPAFDECVNRRFFDWPEAAPGGFRAFDLRDRL